MRLIQVALVALQVLSSTHSFRDFPGTNTASSSFGGSRHSKSCNCTVFEKSYKNALSRKKRSFVFLKNSLLVLTDVAASGIISNYPRSIYHSMELDLYYNIPTGVDGFRKPYEDWIKLMKAQKKAFEMEKEEEKEANKLQNVGTVNVSAIPLDEYNKLAYSRPAFSQFPWKHENSGKRVWNPHRRVYEVNRRPNYRGSNEYYYPNSNRRNYVQRRMTTTTTKAPINSSPKPSVADAYDETDRSFHEAKRSAMKTPQNDLRENRERRGFYDDIGTFLQMRPNYGDSNEYYYPNSNRRNYDQSWNEPTTPEAPIKQTPKPEVLEAYDETDRSFHEIKRRAMKTPQKWHNHREYRERRAFYDHIETFGKMLGVSLRKCVLRAICEMREELLPEGESLINDIARILFTVPTEHDENDEFTEIAREEKFDCARRFMISCPHSPLQYFFKHFRATGQSTRPPTEEDAIKSIIYA